ncbi:MAG TPA: hypothetical protein PKK26_03390 [Candidatus Wallbacteria bacterium]|nr:hypothetical protein [Candidatus Wallbacteria bacterium]
MRKKMFASILVMLLALSINVPAAFAKSNSKNSNNGAFAGQEFGNSSDSQANRPVRAPKQPPANFSGYAISGEDNFELANLSIMSGAIASDSSEVNGTIDIGKQKYLIIQAKTEYEEAVSTSTSQTDESGQIGLEETTKKQPPAMKKIKSFEGRIVKFSEESESQEVLVEAIGEIKVSSVEKEAGANRKNAVMFGTISTDEYKYALYLNMNRAEKPRGGGGGRPPEKGRPGQSGTTDTTGTTTGTTGTTEIAE